MDRESERRLERLQTRINQALQASPADRARTRFSEYMPDSSEPLLESLMRAALPGGLRGIEAAMDEFDRLAGQSDIVALQHALMLFLTHHPDVARAGLTIPPLEQRSPWKVIPSQRGHRE